MGQWADAPAFFEAFGWTVADHDSLEADDLLGTLAELETKAGGSTLLMTGDRDMFQCASKQVTVLYVSTGKGAQQVDSGRGRASLRSPPGAGPRLHRAARRPLRRAPRGEGRRREDGRGAAAKARLARGGARRGDLARRGRSCARRCSGSSDELLAFKRIATLQDAKVKRPRNRATDRKGAAKAARERGMNRLADRLDPPAEQG